jgi:hypothetical protein
MSREDKSTVFISYSNKDRRHFERLNSHLGALGKEGLLRVWSDQALRAGDYWYEGIKNAIEEATAALLLVSADFLNSEFILHEEIPRILQRRSADGLIVFPVIWRPCPWQRVPWLSRMQVRPKDGQPLSPRTVPRIELELAAIAEEVFKLIQ